MKSIGKSVAIAVVSGVIVSLIIDRMRARKPQRTVSDYI